MIFGITNRGGGMKKILVFCFAVFFLSEVSGQAFYVLEPQPQIVTPSGQPLDVCVNPGIVGSEQINDNAPIKGFGKKLPLRTALSMIVPKNFRPVVASSLEDIKVSWESGSPWLSTVDHIARTNNLCVKVRANDYIILVDPYIRPANLPGYEQNQNIVQNTITPEPPIKQSQQVILAPQPIVQAEIPHETISSQGNIAPVTEDLAYKTAIQEIENTKTFVLHEGANIHEELENWCKSEQWSFFWRPGISWKVLKTTTINETSVVKAVQQVIETLRHEKKSIRMEVYKGNNVIEIISTDITMK